jgi:hypothetical protein
MDGFTEVYDTRTGVKTRVPPEWLGDIRLGRFIRKTPSQVAADIAEAAANDVPSDAWTKDQLEEFARVNHIDLDGASTKPKMLAAVTTWIDSNIAAAAQETADNAANAAALLSGTPTNTEPNQGTEETPATGDEEN